MAGEDSSPETSPEVRSIVITGAFSSGKTTFIQTISEIEVTHSERSINSPEPVRVRVNMDFGRISVEGGEFYLFVTPGARRFDFMWELMASGSLIGFIVMIDTTQPYAFREARSILETFAAYAPVPYVVAANFQDQPGAWDVEAVKIALRLDADVSVLPCVATERASVANVLLALCYRILEDIAQSEAEK